MIAPTIFMMASHCGLVNAGDPYSVPTVLVLRSNDGKEPVSARVRAIHVHPDQEPVLKSGLANTMEALCGTPDVALFELMDPVSFPIVRVEHRSILRQGQEVIMGGYGLERNLWSKNSGPEGGNLRVDLRKYSGTIGDACARISSINSKGENSSLARGDSGGPAYIRYTDGSLGVIGVNSAGKNTGVYSYRNAIARLDDGLKLSVPMSTWFNDVMSGRAKPLFSFASGWEMLDRILKKRHPSPADMPPDEEEGFTWLECEDERRKPSFSSIDELIESLAKPVPETRLLRKAFELPPID